MAQPRRAVTTRGILLVGEVDLPYEFGAQRECIQDIGTSPTDPHNTHAEIAAGLRPLSGQVEGGSQQEGSQHSMYDLLRLQIQVRE